MTIRWNAESAISSIIELKRTFGEYVSSIIRWGNIVK
jgi:hypothetical protein